MSNEQSLIKELFKKYTTGKASAEEVKQLFQLISKGNDEEMKSLLLGELQETDLQDNYDNERWNTVFNKVKAETELMEYENRPHKYLGFRKLAVAASIVACLGIGGYWYLHKEKAPQQIAQNQQTDIKPGSNGAILTLANGKRIVLEQTKTGEITQQNGSQLSKAGDSLLVYKAGAATEAVIAYNTLETPRGKQYSVVLPDGSKVWLNAASSIIYPTTFTGNAREVKITGEAYFEVVHNDKQPFRVTVAGQTIEDIGTHFNINAYADEPKVRTTLLEGSISVVKGDKKVIIKPGEQVATKEGDNRLAVTQVNTEDIIAWRNGKFVFDNTDVKTTMRQIARWYDIEVEYQGPVTSHEFGGEIRRNTNLSNVLAIMEQGGIHFRVEGKKVIVTQ